MRTKLFTIALPVRNGGAHLRLCVESILAQTCGDFDLAIFDNASTDGTTEWLATLRDLRVRRYPAERPLSIEANWARIKDIPKAEFLTAIGHDDLLDPDFLTVIFRLIRQRPDAGLYLTHFRIIDSAGKLLRPCLPMPTRESAAEFLAARLCRVRDSFGTGHVFRSSVYDVVGGIPPFPKLFYADDALFMRTIGASYRATALEEAFSYRMHTASTTGHAAMSDLFAGLEHYARLLLDLQKDDPAMRTVLSRHFADHALHIGEALLDQKRLEAYHARRSLDPDVRRCVLALATTFGEISRPMPPVGLRRWLLEKAAVNLPFRLLFQGMALKQRLGLAVGRGLLRLAHSDQLR